MSNRLEADLDETPGQVGLELAQCQLTGWASRIVHVSLDDERRDIYEELAVFWEDDADEHAEIEVVGGIVADRVVDALVEVLERDVQRRMAIAEVFPELTRHQLVFGHELVELRQEVCACDDDLLLV